MLSMLLILLIVLGLAGGMVVLRRSANQRKTPCACECCHNITEVERPVV